MLLLLLSCTLVADRLGTPRDPGDATEHVFTVPKGATARTLGDSLEAEGVVADGGSFRMYVRLKGEGGCIKAGRFRLRPDMSAEQILETLCGPPMPEDVPFTVVEGWRIREIDAALAAAGLAPTGAYIGRDRRRLEVHALRSRCPKDRSRGTCFRRRTTSRPIASPSARSSSASSTSSPSASTSRARRRSTPAAAWRPS